MNHTNDILRIFINRIKPGHMHARVNGWLLDSLRTADAHLNVNALYTYAWLPVLLPVSIGDRQVVDT